MQFSLILLSILGAAVASPVDIKIMREELLSRDVGTRNNTLEKLVLGLLEDLRKIMQTGYGAVPVLDPLQIEHLNLDDEILPVPGAKVTVKDLAVSKLTTFVVNSLIVRTESIFPLRYRISFDIHVPELEVEAANYDLLVLVGSFNIFGNGDAKIKLTKPRVQGSLVLGPRITIGSGLYFSISSSEVKLSLKDFDSQINGLLNDDSMSEFLNTFLKNFVPELLQLYEADITRFLSATVKEIGNDFLADLNLAGILG